MTNEITQQDKDNAKTLLDKGAITQEQYKNICTPVTPTECFDKKKFISGLVNVTNPVLWAKEFSWLLNFRKLILVILIIGSIFGYGYWKGLKGKPVHFDLRGKEATIKLNEHYLKIEKDGTAKVIDKDGNILKTIRVKDIPALEKALKPVGMTLKPFFTAGGSLGATGAKAEVGFGMEWMKYYKLNFNSFITNIGLYPLGIGYKITDNFDALLGGGFGYGGDQRVFIGGKFKF